MADPGGNGTQLWPLRFVHGFCDYENAPDTFEKFKNQLGYYTPCFTDIIVLGVSHLVSIILTLLRLRIQKRRIAQQYKIRNFAKFYQWSAAIAAFCSTLIPVIQLGARLGQTSVPLGPKGGTDIAPYEWPAYILPIIAWLLMTLILIRELRRFTWEGLWMVRFSLVLICAAQLTKMMFVVRIVDHNLFFWVFIVQSALQCYLCIFALTQFPRKTSLVRTAVSASGYEMIPDMPSEVSTAEECSSNVCPEDSAGWFSRLTFGWMGPLIKTGYKTPLEPEDVWELCDHDKAGKTSSEFTKHWNAELQRKQNNKNASLVRAMRKSVGYLFYWAIPLKLVTDASQFVGPVFLKLLLDVVDTDAPSYIGYIYAGSMFLGLILGTFADNQHFQLVMRAGFRLRSLLTAQVHRKSLYITPTARAKYSSGRIFNFVATDAESLQILCQNLLGIVSSPLRIAGAMIMLYIQLGAASLVALASLILMLPIQAVVVKKTATYLKKALSSTDERAKLEGELLAGIEVVKCSAWEEPLKSRIMDVRKTELAVLWRSFVLSAINVFLLTSIPAIVSVTTFAVFVLLGGQLTAAKAFTAVTLFNVLRLPLFQLPQLITQLTQASVSIQRLEGFLSEDEHGQRKELPPARPGQHAVSMHGDFSWDVNAAPFLKNIQLDVPCGNLVAVVGSTGAGKTSLVSAMLGLMQQTHGEPPTLRGGVALVPQSPFIVNATVRENILFGREYDEDRYTVAIHSACLEPDFHALPGGDLTELGERGVNVSGGQKQRIAIARAVYAGADVFVLDDPLSALDSKVGREVFNKCLVGAIESRTRVLVTNQLQYVNSADLVVYLDNGQIGEMGTYEELMAKEGGFAQMMAEAQVEEDAESEAPEKEQAETLMPSESQSSAASLPRQLSNRLKRTVSSGRDVKLVEREKRAKGVVSRDVLWAYVKAMGGFWPFAFLMVQFMLCELLRVGTNIWLTVWTNKEPTPQESQWYMNIYTLISLGQILLTLVNTLDLKWLSRIAADNLHQTMLEKLLRAPMAFFHTTPIGRIINRFTKDTSDIDKNLADYMGFFMRSILQLISTAILVGFFTPFTLPCLVPILLLFYFLYLYFQTSVREIKRLDAVSRSPVYSSINEALGGLATIRAFGAEVRLIERHMNLVDGNIVMNLANQSMNRWLSIRLETLGAVAALAAGVLAVEQRGASAIMGLTLSYALQITALTSMTVRLASLAENMFNAVERVVEYGAVEPEAPADVDGSVPDCWPDQGAIMFNNVQMRYRPGLPLVLKGLSAEVEGGQKVGVVGRTGAGKSSLINSLFRLAEMDGGSIIIDGIDISKVGLSQLRGRMAIIPQVPVLFTGSIRSNLDPFNQYTDGDLWAALRRAHLDKVCEASMRGLDMPLQEGGAPLSAGQKQLLTLARALLSRSKILVLDEATANVDVETDAVIQRTIRSEFADCTVVAIAHRLHTIIDGDRILVLDKGMTAEFDSPSNLLQQPNGVFSSMVHETGEGTEKFLRAIALGDVSIEEIQAADAERGLERLSSTAEFEHSATTVSNELLERAVAAVENLKRITVELDERNVQYEEQKEMGVESGMHAGEGLLSAMKEALGLVVNVEALAERAQGLLQRGVTELEKPEKSVDEFAAPDQGQLAVKRWRMLRTAVRFSGLKRRATDYAPLPQGEDDHVVQY